MKITTPSIGFIDIVRPDEIMRKIEYACRTCYQSYDKTSEGSAQRLIKSCILRGHESILEHQSLTFAITCSRACLAQWTRHRISSFSVESQRYCNYGKEQWGRDITYIQPWFARTEDYDDRVIEEWEMACEDAETAYFAMLDMGAKPEDARGVLPQDTATHMVWTANLREIRHFLTVRSAPSAQYEIRMLAKSLAKLMYDAGLGIFIEDLISYDKLQLD